MVSFLLRPSRLLLLIALLSCTLTVCWGFASQFQELLISEPQDDSFCAPVTTARFDLDSLTTLPSTNVSQAIALLSPATTICIIITGGPTIDATSTPTISVIQGVTIFANGATFKFANWPAVSLEGGPDYFARLDGARFMLVGGKSTAPIKVHWNSIVSNSNFDAQLTGGAIVPNLSLSAQVQLFVYGCTFARVSSTNQPGVIQAIGPGSVTIWNSKFINNPASSVVADYTVPKVLIINSYFTNSVGANTEISAVDADSVIIYQSTFYQIAGICSVIVASNLTIAQSTFYSACDPGNPIPPIQAMTVLYLYNSIIRYSTVIICKFTAGRNSEIGRKISYFNPPSNRSDFHSRNRCSDRTC